VLSRRALIGTAIAGTGAALAACAPRPAAGTTRLDAVDVHPPGYPTVEAVAWIAAELARETGGRVTLRQFPSGQLGAEDDTLGFARYNAIAICRVAVAALNNAFPHTRLLALPYGFRSTDHMRRVVDGPIGTELLAGFERRGLVGLAYYDAAPRSFYNIRGPIETPADLNGLKIRSPLSDMVLETLAAMGANPTPLSFGGIFSALETHLIDGAENNLPSYESSRHFETARYWSETDHSQSPDALLVSKAALDALQPADQDLLRDIARRSVAVQRAAWDARVARSRAEVLAAGAIFNRPDPAPFIRATEAVRRRHTADPALAALYRRIEATA
jgi:tripartite ATP-independent transporter DctP family solute receptor